MRFIYIFTVLFSLSINAEESVLVHSSFSGSTEVVNNTLIIQNGSVSVKNIKDPIIKIDVSTPNNKIKRVIVRNVHINSSNANLFGDKEQSSLFQLNLGNKKTYLNNININTFSSNITNRTKGASSCAGALCLKAKSKKSIFVKNVNVHTYGNNKFESVIK